MTFAQPLGLDFSNSAVSEAFVKLMERTPLNPDDLRDKPAETQAALIQEAAGQYADSLIQKIEEPASGDNHADLSRASELAALIEALRPAMGILPGFKKRQLAEHWDLLVKTIKDADKLWEKSPRTSPSLPLVSGLSPTPDVIGGVARLVLEDLIRKYARGGDIRELAPSEAACLAEIGSWDFSGQADVPVSRLIHQIITRFHPELTEERRQERVGKAMTWLREKYGVADRPLFALPDRAKPGSYQTPGDVQFSVSPARLPPLFNSSEPSSIQDLGSYIERKWGGLGGVAAPDRVIFSELGSVDTLAGLKAQGFNRFHLVNAAYAARGSKTILAMKPGDTEPTIVFYSFVSPDLFYHKLKQLAVQYGPSFTSVKVLTSNNLKSWEVADLVVTRAINKLPDIAIDDLVIGYSGAIEAGLLKRGKPFRTARLGDFATVKYFTVTGKTGLARTVVLLTDIELRYFGKSALTLVKPFFNRGIDRVLFAGSAGSVDPAVPIHSLVIPRSFHRLDESGTVSARVDIDNDLFDLLPYGASYSGRHVSVPSPLVETQSMIRRFRQDHDVLSVDVEGSQIADLILEHNKRHGGRIRFGAAFIVTDTPVTAGEKGNTGYGLHQPDYKGKAEAKKTYAEALDLLWDVPGRFKPSAHTRFIGAYYSRRIAQLIKSGDTVAMAALYSEIQARLEKTRRLSHEDRRVSRGLAKAYLDLLRALDKDGAVPLRARVPIRAPGTLERLSRPLQKIVLLQSLTRSSTLNSGEVGYSKDTPAAVRASALRNAERAVEYALARTDWPLEAADIHKIHALLNADILPTDKLGRIRNFSYQGQDGAPTTSSAEFGAFAQWLSSVRPSPAAALEAFLRFEELHPYEDGNGRTAELIAQHLMIRATGHPFLFPNRFDIDYILSLRRNGSGPSSDAHALARTLQKSGEFSNWLKAHIPGVDESSARIVPVSGLVTIRSEDKAFVLQPLFRLNEPLPLEREERIFLPASADFSRQALPTSELPSATLVQGYSEYDAAINLYAVPVSAESRVGQPAFGEGRFLNFGGSFSPPTDEHMGLLANLMHRFGFTRAKMVPTFPYKPGAAPAEVSLELTRVGVENFREILALISISYKNFRSWAGGSSWKGPDGRLYSLAVDDYDIRVKNQENTLKTLEHLRRAHGGDAKANYWLSGVDSFASISSWTPQWRELFAQTNWIVVSRPGFTKIDFKRRDPLRGVFEDAFLSDYEYSFDEAKQMHVYNHHDPAKPGIFLIDQPTLDDSSTKHRKSFAEEGDHEHAQAGLQPSVFKRALEKGYYSKNGPAGGYAAFTRRNLEGYLSYLYERIENPDGDPVSAEEARDFERFTDAYVELARAQASAEVARPWHRKAASAIAEHVGEFFRNIISIPNLGENLRKLYKKVGEVAAVYIIGETIIEPLVVVIATVLFGPAGTAVAMSPIGHINDWLIMPAYLTLRVMLRHRRQRRLAGGDLSLFRKITNYRNRLLRGDPDVTVARMELNNALGLKGAPITLNIVKSSLPKWVPLWIRRFDDRRKIWQDLNVSTNELKAILGDKALSSILEEESDGNDGKFAHRLVKAIFQQPAARLRFELFLSQRYFKRLALGQIPNELMGGFIPAEREAIAALNAQADLLRKALGPAQLDEAASAVADFYSLIQAARIDPKRVRTGEFWTEFIDLMATRYPGRQAALGNEEAALKLAERLTVFGQKLVSLMPEAFQGVDISYHGRKLARLGASTEILDEALGRAIAEIQAGKGAAKAGRLVEARALENSVAHYIDSNRAFFQAPAAAAPLDGQWARLLATSSRGEDLSGGNLVWEILLLDSHVRGQRDILAKSFERGERFLLERHAHPEAGKIFRGARKAVERDLSRLRQGLLELEYEWLMLKVPYQIGPASADESGINGYKDVVARYADLRSRIEGKLEALRSINHMMLGTVPLDVTDMASVTAALGQSTGPKESK